METYAPAVSAWTAALLRADATRPGDAAERAADAAGGAAEHGARTARPRPAARGRAADTGTPPWGSGRALHTAERAWHERVLGADLGDVRVHEGEAPARWARGLGARAFSVGRDVVLGNGAYSPASAPGRRLLGHELAHVVAARGRATPLLARVTLSAADFEAIADSLNAALTSTTSDEELVYVALQKVARDATATATLRATYRTRHTNDLDTDLAKRLKGSALALAKGLLAAKGGTAIPAAPASAKAHDALAKAAHAALTAKTPKPEAVYAALLPVAQNAAAATALRAAYTALFTTTLDSDVTTHLAGADRAYALYLLNAPGPASPITSAFQSPPGFGTSAKTATIAGGTLSAGTKVPFTTATGSSASATFGYGYSGGLAHDTRFLQAISREIVVTDAKGTRSLSDTVSIGTRTYALTQPPPAARTYSIDSDRSTTPFFDEAHPSSGLRDATSVATYDTPSPIKKLVTRELAAGATTVVSKARFDVFAIRDFAPVHHFVIEVTWTFTDPTSLPAATRQVVSSTAVTALPADVKAQLDAQYPSFSYIR
ncbi:MAG TPA: DUF4157 domain-containing protein [Frankiaceae bacterium]|jgi:hypothetical protein|nr:DUF4157 domain-containing protein [Frankiaceae bacterium]